MDGLSVFVVFCFFLSRSILFLFLFTEEERGRKEEEHSGIIQRGAEKVRMLVPVL